MSAATAQTATTTAVVAIVRPVRPPVSPLTGNSLEMWGRISGQRPVMMETAGRYLQQISLSLSPSSVRVYDQTLRGFCVFLSKEHPTVIGFTMVTRPVLEDYKSWLANQRGRTPDSRSTANTIRQRLNMMRNFFDRIIEWDWPDAPARNPVFSTDMPMVDADAIVSMRDGHWLKIPIGKLRTDRYVPLHPQLLELLNTWKATHDNHGTGWLLTRNGTPLNTAHITRFVRHVAAQAGIGHVRPHQLRHTFATQAVNRGMRIEAIRAMLGHRTLKMTLVYAQTANQTVADEYRAASTKVDALSGRLAARSGRFAVPE